MLDGRPPSLQELCEHEIEVLLFAEEVDVALFVERTISWVGESAVVDDVLSVDAGSMRSPVCEGSKPSRRDRARVEGSGNGVRTVRASGSSE